MAKDEESTALVQLNPRADIVRASGADLLLNQIRPEWKRKNLITRVKRILPVDPSSACQRLLNAAFHDLRQKIVRAGLDVADEAAARFGLPRTTKAEDVLENYSNSNTIDLAYRIGLLSRAEWRRLQRAYDIRRDLEHEDEDYEAAIEDILYIFKTSIEAVLSREPIEPLQLSEVEELVNATDIATASPQFLDDYRDAPPPRQLKISTFLVTTALNSKKADVVRQNAVELLRSFEPLTHQSVKVDLGEIIQSRLGTGRLELVVAKVAAAAGVLGYLKRRQVADFFAWLYSRLEEVGHGWRNYEGHVKILDDLEDVGGLSACPASVRPKIVLWLTLCYLGEPGGYGYHGAIDRSFTATRPLPELAECSVPRVKNSLRTSTLP